MRPPRSCTSARPAAMRKWRSYCPPFSSDSVAPDQPLLPLRPLRERDRIEQLGGLVADVRKGAADGAGRLVVAIAARRVEIDAGAGHQSDRPFHCPDDVAERNLIGRAGQAVAAL